MQITVNGKTRQIDAVTHITALLESLGLDPARVAVEHNLAIVPLAEFSATPIAEGDSLEIVQFVGGG
jgi:thiamine biosynthesis protein ThiS